MSDAGTATFNHDVKVNDNSKFFAGTSGDLEIYHDGSNSYIHDNGAGDLNLAMESGSKIVIQGGTSGNHIAEFNHNGAAELMYNGSQKLATTTSGISVTGDVDSSSDINLKDNVETIENAYDKVSNLRGVNFNWKDSGKYSMGVIAQEVEEIIPEVVSTNEEGSKSVNYQAMVGVLIEAVKTLQAKVEDLENGSKS
jgi:hypothetical protein